LGKTDSIVSTAAAHHRLCGFHPFLDGNGRVARLLSHAMFLETLDTGGVGLSPVAWHGARLLTTKNILPPATHPGAMILTAGESK